MCAGVCPALRHDPSVMWVQGPPAPAKCHVFPHCFFYNNNSILKIINDDDDNNNNSNSNSNSNSNINSNSISNF